MQIHALNGMDKIERGLSVKHACVLGFHAWHVALDSRVEVVE